MRMFHIPVCILELTLSVKVRAMIIIVEGGINFTKNYTYIGENNLGEISIVKSSCFFLIFKLYLPPSLFPISILSPVQCVDINSTSQECIG